MVTMPEEPRPKPKPAGKPPEEMSDALKGHDPQPNLPPPEDFSSAAPSPAPRPENLPQAPLAADPAQAFHALRQQALTLAESLRKGDISFEQYQRRLMDAMVPDEQGNWWILDAVKDEWYRHDNASQQWVVDHPPALQALDPDVTLTEHLLPYELPPAYSAPRAAAPARDERGVKLGNAPPTHDANITIPGKFALVQEIPSPRAPDQPAARREISDISAPNMPELLRAQRRSRQRLPLIIAAAVLIVLLAAGIIFTGFVMMWYRDTIEPYSAAIANLEGYRPAYQTARIFDAEGNLLASLDNQETGARTTVSLEEISPYMIHAIVSQENERFYADPGFDPIAIIRAFLQNLQSDTIESGASTITQQIARNLVLQDRDVTVQRKITEILVALDVASRYNKEKILELYLNDIFFGNRSYGVEAAANFYFGKSAAQLNFAESALLAAIVPAPQLHDPLRNRAAAIAGMRTTMKKMLAIGCLPLQHGQWQAREPFCIRSDEEVELDGQRQVLVRVNDSGEIAGGLAILQIAQLETTDFQATENARSHPHFVDYVSALVTAELGEEALYKGGLNIYTTLDPALQDVAQAALSQQVQLLRAQASGVNTGAIMVSSPRTGAILAMVGSHDYSDATAGQLNHALSYQQPGSAIKPFVYMDALQGDDGASLNPASILWDVPLVQDLGGGGTYAPQNLDRRFHGAVPLREALQNSYNIPAVKVFRDHVGVGRFANMAETVGLQFPEEAFLSLSSALGANEVRLYDLLSAYSIFANEGMRAPLYAIERITETVQGEAVEIPREPPPPQAVISPALAYLMQNILSDDAARAPSIAPGSALTLSQLGIPSQNTVAAKTGTSNEGRDLWTLGFTQDAVVGVWLGTTDNSPTFNTSGIESAAPLWNTVMSAVARKYPPLPFNNPGAVVAREFCRSTGTLSYPACPDTSVGLFLQGQYPPAPESAFLQRATVDSWTLLRANEHCPHHAVDMNFAVIDDAAALDWLNNSDDGRAYAEKLGLALPVRPPPAAACTPGQQLPLVNISSPNPGQTLGGSIDIRGQVQAPNFDRFELLYASSANPDRFYPISASLVQMPDYATPLGTWDTIAAQVPDGDTTLRLVVTAENGGRITVERNIRIDSSVAPQGTALPAFSPAVDLITTPSSGG